MGVLCSVAVHTPPAQAPGRLTNTSILSSSTSLFMYKKGHPNFHSIQETGDCNSVQISRELFLLFYSIFPLTARTTVSLYCQQDAVEDHCSRRGKIHCGAALGNREQ
jgi:hypothetical protein